MQGGPFRRLTNGSSWSVLLGSCTNSWFLVMYSVFVVMDVASDSPCCLSMFSSSAVVLTEDFEIVTEAVLPVRSSDNEKEDGDDFGFCKEWAKERLKAVGHDPINREHIMKDLGHCLTREVTPKILGSVPPPGSKGVRPMSQK